MTESTARTAGKAEKGSETKRPFKVLAMAGTQHNIWMVESENYKTYDTLCPAVQFELQSKRPHAVAQVTPRDKVYEHEALIWFLRPTAAEPRRESHPDYVVSGW